jgi:hypothetical protein
MGCVTSGGQRERGDALATAVFDVPRLESILIDGTAEDWGTRGFRVDALMPDGEAMPDRRDFGAALRLGWNETGLLVLLELTARDWREAEKITELFQHDSAEFYLATHPGSAQRCQWLVAPGMDPQHPEPRVNLQDFATAPRLRAQAVAPSVARVRTATGCRLEVLLPWRTLGIAPTGGDEVAFQIMVNSHERKGRPADHLLWFPMTGAAFDSRKLHRLRLSDRASPPVVARARVSRKLRENRTECEVFAAESDAGRAVRLRSATGLLATGVLGAPTNGFARATLAGPGTEAALLTLEVDGQPADWVPLELPRAEMALETRVRLESAGTNLSVVLEWPAAAAAGCRVMRRRPGDGPWAVLADKVSASTYRDPAVRSGELYEYGVVAAGEEPVTDYFWTGQEVALRDRRGTALLVVERTQGALLQPEIRRLMLDLAGDGWQVRRLDVDATQAPAEVRRWIRTEYDRAPAEVNTVLLLGHVPVPYAGSVCPDGHPDHAGAWPADVYYGAMEGAWTDTAAGSGRNGTQRNERGDGRLDQAVIPGRVQLAVGRVDFAILPLFPDGETTLLRRYLDRDHAYRQARLSVAACGFVHDGFFGQPERFAYSGWQNFTTLLPPEQVRNVAWPNVKPGMNLFFSACGPGAHTSMKGFGDTAALVKTPVEAVFALMFGSYFGDWNTTNNFLRAVIAHEQGALTCGWAGRPHWYLHAMGMGETIGDAARRTQNNDGGDYQPAGAFARGIHIALLGDPTLRLHPVPPPGELRVHTVERGVRLSWTPAPRKVLGYHVYRSRDEFGAYERITQVPLAELTLLDPAGTAAHHYQIRAVVLQETTTGSYYNASQGVFGGRAEP